MVYKQSERTYSVHFVFILLYLIMFKQDIRTLINIMNNICGRKEDIFSTLDNPVNMKTHYSGLNKSFGEAAEPILRHYLLRRFKKLCPRHFFLTE